MPIMSLDNALWIVSFVADGAVVGLLVYRRVWRMLPVFCSYCAWALFTTAGSYVVFRFFPAGYFKFYLAQITVDSALEFAVLIELAWSVLRPVRSSLPRGALVAVAVLVLALGAAIWPFAIIPGFSGASPGVHFLVRLQQTTSILQVVFFLALAGCSQMLSIGWRDRELQVATGFGFYSLVGLVVAMLHTHLAMRPYYAQLNQVVVAASLCSLFYWVFSFAQKEAERRELTPQMQSLLLAVAGSARAARVAMSDSTLGNEQKPRKR